MIDDKEIKSYIYNYRNQLYSIEIIKIYLSNYIYNYPRKTFFVEHSRALPWSELVQVHFHM